MSYSGCPIGNLSLPFPNEKITYEPFHSKVLFKTLKYNEYFKENFKVFDVLDFIALVTAHIPPKHNLQLRWSPIVVKKGEQYIRRYGRLCKAKEYSSRSRGKWKEYEYIRRLAPDGWKEKHEVTEKVQQEVAVEETSTVGTKQQRSAWARLIRKVYGVDPLICPNCGKDMKIIAIIMDPEETTKILRYLIKTGRSPPNFNPDSLN